MTETRQSGRREEGGGSEVGEVENLLEIISTGQRNRVMEAAVSRVLCCGVGRVGNSGG